MNPGKEFLAGMVCKMPVRLWINQAESYGPSIWSTTMVEYGWPYITGPWISFDDPRRVEFAKLLDELCGGRNNWALVGPRYFFNTHEDAVRIKLTIDDEMSSW